METLSLTFGAAAAMGLAFGAGPCNLSCLPYLGPVFLTPAGAGRRAWRRVVPFSLGRLFSYALLGAAAGSLGQAAAAWLERGPAAVALGGATLLLGWGMWRRAGGRPACGRSAAVQPLQRGRPQSEGALSAGLFGMGAAMALNPCLPLSTVLLAATASASAWSGLWLGLAFGLGAILLPSLVFTWVIAHFGAQVRAHLERWRGTVERGAAVMLMSLGTLTAMGWVRP